MDVTVEAIRDNADAATAHAPRITMASRTFMITSGAAPAPLLHHHRRVSRQHAQDHDSADPLHTDRRATG